MRILIYGAGTIGLTYAWLLSKGHEIDVLVRTLPINQVVRLQVKDMSAKNPREEKIEFSPHYVTEIESVYDFILITVNRYQLSSVLQHLQHYRSQTKFFVIMQNNWNLQVELAPYLPDEQVIIAFPSNVGGGRDEQGLQIILFPEAVRLGGKYQPVQTFSDMLQHVGIKTRHDKAIFDWLTVHYLQQSITGGALATCSDFHILSTDDQLLKRIALAFREGIEVCRLRGVKTQRMILPILFRLPLPLVVYFLKQLFSKVEVQEMIINHKKKGFSEWLVGYFEVLNDGRNMGLKMENWGYFERSAKQQKKFL